MKIRETIIGLLLLIFVVAFVVLLAFYLDKKNDEKTAGPISDLITEARTEAKIIARSVDEKGYTKTVIERQREIIGNGDITKLPVSQSVIDSLRLDNLDKTKKLQQASLINATIKAENLQATKLMDSLKRTYYLYKDQFTTAKFTPDSNGGKFDINYKISLIRHDYSKKIGYLVRVLITQRY